MTIYHIDAEDPMNSSMSCDRVTIGYFLNPKKALACMEKYNRNFKRPSMFLAQINEIEVIE